MRTLTRGGAALVLCGLLALSGCDNSSAVETRDRTAKAEPVARMSMPATGEEAATPQEKAVLTANRRETVDAKIARLYDRNGADFGARSAEDYLTKVTAFTTKPPRDAETVKRPNGDTLIYQASTNTFAVVDSDGVPRTMFKPDDGPAYWEEQKASMARRQASRSDGARAE